MRARCGEAERARHQHPPRRQQLQPHPQYPRHSTSRQQVLQNVLPLDTADKKQFDVYIYVQTAIPVLPKEPGI